MSMGLGFNSDDPAACPSPLATIRTNLEVVRFLVNIYEERLKNQQDTHEALHLAGLQGEERALVWVLKELEKDND